MAKRELAEMATQSQTQAWEVINRRFHENLEEFKALMHPSSRCLLAGSGFLSATFYFPAEAIAKA